MKPGSQRMVLPLSGAVVAILFLTGCGGHSPSAAKVRGEVKYEGKLIEKGTIAFLPEDGKGPAVGGDIQGGRFSVLVPPGVKRVEVRAPKVVGTRKPFDTAESVAVDVIEDLLPPAYNTQSKLSYKIEVPETTLHLDLKAAAPVARR